MRNRRRRLPQLRLERSGPWIAIGGLLVLLWLAIASSVFAPWWGVVVLVALLVPQVVLVARWAPRRPERTPWVPVGGLVAWLALSLVGAFVLGWA